MRSGNQLTSLPDSFASLTRLTVLELSYVAAASRAVCACVCVTVVSSGNRLTSLRDSFVNLKQLIELDLSCVSP